MLDTLWSVLKGLPGLDENVVKDYALLYADHMELLRDADCETLLSPTGKEYLSNNEILIQDILKELQSMGKDMFSKRAYLFFINQQDKNA